MIKYFYTDGNAKFGPFTKEELKMQKITRDTKIWYYGIEKWTELSNIKELNDIFTSIPPNITNPYLNNNKDKSIDSLIHQKTPLIKVNTNSISKSNIKKWAIGILSVLTISIVVHKLIKYQSKIKLYNIIVADSYESDDNFEVYVDKFYRDLEFHGIFPKKPKKTIIKFSKLDQLDNTTHIHGVCFGSNDDDIIEIYLNPSTWKQFNKPMRHYLMYHELAHDILNLDDLPVNQMNEGKIMFPELSHYENKKMDDFIESSHALFIEQSLK